MKRHWIHAVTLTAIVAAVAYLAIILWTGRADVSAAFGMLRPDTLLALLALSLANYLIRFGRWRTYLRQLGVRLDLLHDLRIYIGGFALTTTPGKSGELARTLWLRPYGVPVDSSAAVFLVERVQDFIAIVVLSSLGLSLYPGAAGRWALLAGIALVIAVFSVFLLSDRVERLANMRTIRPLHRLLMKLASVSRHARDCVRPRPLLVGLFAGLIAWSCEGMAFAILLRALGHPVTPVTALSIYAFSMLAGAISFMPGGLGSSEATMILLLRFVGVPLSLAVPATLIIRATTLWFAVLLGVLALSIRLRPSVGALAEGSK
jgi:uncharacterized protein (TIRG00374 family)